MPTGFMQEGTHFCLIWNVLVLSLESKPQWFIGFRESLYFSKRTLSKSYGQKLFQWKVRYIKVSVHLQRTRCQYLCCLLLCTRVTLGTSTCTKPAHWFFMVFFSDFLSWHTKICMQEVDFQGLEAGRNRLGVVVFQFWWLGGGFCS